MTHRRITWAIVWPILVTALFALVCIYGSLDTITVGPRPEIPPEDSPADILAKVHDCWSGDAPADMVGKLPGHVVVIRPDGTAFYGGRHYVGLALDQIFNHHDHGLEIRAFCR
jgi:hypothetical protein